MNSPSTLPAAGRISTAVAPALLERHRATLRSYLATLPGAETQQVDQRVKEVFERAEAEASANLMEDPVVWLFTEARRQVMSRGQRGDVLRTDDRAAATEEPEVVEGEDSRIAVHRIFGRLTAKQQESLRLKFQFGFTLEEVARITGLSKSGTGGLLHHAMHRVVLAAGGLAGRSGDLLLTAYALDELEPEEKKAYVDNVSDGKALLQQSEAIRQAGRLLVQVLASGAPVPQRRRKRGRKFRWLWPAGFLLVLVVAGGWFVARGKDQAPANNAAVPVVSEEKDVAATGTKSIPAGDEPEAEAPADRAGFRSSSGRTLRPGEADWERKAFGQGTGQAAGATGGTASSLPGLSADAVGAGEGNRREVAVRAGGPPDSSDPGSGARVAREKMPLGADEFFTRKASHDGVVLPGAIGGAGAGSLGAGAVSAGAPLPVAGSTFVVSGHSGAPKLNQVAATPVPAAGKPVADLGDLKRQLAQGRWPNPEEVGVAALLRQLPAPLAAPRPSRGTEPLRANRELAPSPWKPGSEILLITLEARPAPPPARNLANVVLAIDVSESMIGPNRLPLVVAGIERLVERLRPEDRITIVTYAASAEEVLPGAPLESSREALRSRLHGLTAGGLTNGYAGLELAYEAARKGFIPGGLNVVLLCTDGNFNLGEIHETTLARLASSEAAAGVNLSVFGFGRSDRNDLRLELLAAQGGGRSCYVNTREEAERLLSTQVNGLLMPVATEVALRVEFNGDQVKTFRRLDEEPGGEVAEILPGRSITALYEVEFTHEATDPSGAWGRVLVDFSRPGTQVSDQLVHPLTGAGRQDGAEVDPGFKFAIGMAELAQILQGEAAVAGPGLDRLESWIREQLPDDDGGYRHELLELVAAARLAAGRG